MHDEGTIVQINYIHSTPRGGRDQVMSRLTDATSSESLLECAIREALLATMDFTGEVFNMRSPSGSEGRMSAGGGIPYSISVTLSVPADQAHLTDGGPAAVASEFRNHLVGNLRAVFKEWPDGDYTGIPEGLNIIVICQITTQASVTHPI